MEAEEGKPRGTPSLGEACIHPGSKLSSADALKFPVLPEVSLSHVSLISSLVFVGTLRGGVNAVHSFPGRNSCKRKLKVAH